MNWFGNDSCRTKQLLKFSVVLLHFDYIGIFFYTCICMQYCKVPHSNIEGITRGGGMESQRVRTLAPPLHNFISWIVHFFSFIFILVCLYSLSLHGLPLKTRLHVYTCLLWWDFPLTGWSPAHRGADRGLAGGVRHLWQEQGRSHQSTGTGHRRP